MSAAVVSDLGELERWLEVSVAWSGLRGARDGNTNKPRVTKATTKQQISKAPKGGARSRRMSETTLGIPTVSVVTDFPSYHEAGT